MKFRVLTATTVFTALALSLTSQGAISADAKGPIVISSWGGAYTENEKKYFAEPFTKETGIQVEFLASATLPSAPALLQAASGHVTIDIVEAENGYLFESKGLAAPFPPELMSVLKQTSRPGSYSPYQLLMGKATSLIACNVTLIAESACPTNPKEFWDVKKFPGTRALRNRPYEVFLFALEAAGVQRDKLYPIDVDKAVAKLNEIKSKVSIWPPNTAKEAEILTNAQVAISYTSGGVALRAINAGAKGIKLFPTGGVSTQADGYLVMTQAPHKDAAFKYIEWIANHPEAQREWSKASFYSTVSKTLPEFVIDDKLLGHGAASGASVEKNIVYRDPKWDTEHAKQIQAAWQDFLVGR